MFFELEGVINLQDYCFKFLNRSLSFFPKENITLKPKEQKFIRVNAPFIDEISGLAIVRLVDEKTHTTMLLKLKFTCNVAMLDVVNNGTDTVIFKPEEMIGIVDLRSLGYYKIKQGTLLQNVSKYYRFDNAETLSDYFTKFVNMLRQEKEQKDTEEKYPWVDPTNK